MSDERRTLLVFGEKTFQITVPRSHKITFGPFSPPRGDNRFQPEGRVGTLRIYDKSKEMAVAVFSGVRGYRDLALNYMEEVAVEEGARIWKSDEQGYMREEKVSGSRKWITPEPPAIESGASDPEVPF